MHEHIICDYLDGGLHDMGAQAVMSVFNRPSPLCIDAEGDHMAALLPLAATAPAM
jgi:hypothetical protein